MHANCNFLYLRVIKCSILEKLIMNKNHKKILLTILKILAVILSFILIFKNIDFSKIGPAVKHVQWWTIPVLFSTALCMTILQGVRWWLLIRAFTNKLSFIRSMAYHFSSLFYSLILPNSLSQDIIRSIYATRQTGSIISWSSTWIAKISGIIVSCGFSIYGLILLSGNELPKSILLITAIMFLVLLMLAYLSFSKRSTRILRKIVLPVIPKKFVAWLEEFREGIYQFKNKKLTLLIVFACTILIQLIFITGITFLISGITGNMYFAECAAFMPLIEIISVAQPFTPNGIGVREALVAIMFRNLGLTTEQLGIYVIISNMAILVKLLGVIPILKGFGIKTTKSD